MEVIIFCGIQASGKTTFYKEKFFKTHIRLSLDQLKTRKRESKFLETCVATHQPFVVDNTNPGRSNRARYISIAKANKFKIIGYFFKSEIEEGLIRNSQRLGKENIPEIAIQLTFNKFEIPAFEEGFDELYEVEISDNKFLVSEWTG